MAFSPLQRIFSLALSLFILTIFAATWWAQNVALSVNEKGCRLNFEEEQVKAIIAVENKSSKALPVTIKLELLDQSDHVRYNTARDETIKSGSSSLSFDLTKLEFKDVAFSDDKLWWRLRYEVSSPENTTTIQGIISASAITPDIFDLQVFASSEALVGTKYQARVRTAHPLTGSPVSNVSILAIAKHTEKEKEITSKVTAKTNQDGYAVLTFDLPKDIDEDDDDFEIEFTAKKGSLEREEEISLNLFQTDTYIVTTDKNLYQPGQTIHTRVVLFNQQKQARADYEMDAAIEDGEDQNVYRTKIKTSKFGVAAFDWPIPENTKLGGYKIKIGIQTPRRIWGEANVKISRYDLPNFSVKTKPDKTYYLPNENAEIEVKADYLFGQPVTKGSVKVVREADRHWNNKTYKYDIEEGEIYRGEIDASGKFIAKVDLKELQEKFTVSGWRKFEDVHFAAYVTDATTGRTEQRRFDLRLTKEPIHIYLIKEENYAANELIDAYVNASYADGSPAQCDVEIFQKIESDNKDKEAELKLLSRVSTNKYGLAKVTGLQRIKADEDDSSDVEFVMQAKDAQGKTGHADSEINIADEPTIRVNTDKALYRTGETISATIKCSVPNSRAVLEVLQAGRVVSSQLIEVHDGAATVKIPYKSELKDDVTLVAYANVFDEEDDDVKFIYASRAILYPRDRELKLSVKLSRPEYQPGEEAHAELMVKNADGKPVNSVLGAMIVDTAVGERERTDNEFRGSNG
jgi:MG2 domain/Alpha-2-macroglobulin bait region domain